MAVNEVQSSDAPRSEPPSTRGLVIKNTLYLSLAQVLQLPLSILLTAVMGRYLTPEDFGLNYLATTMAMFGWLAVDWGHQGALPAAVATDRAQAGRYLGSSLAWRIPASFVAYAVLALGCFLLDYPKELQLVLALVCLAKLLSTATNACQEATRGLERTDIAAMNQVGSSILELILIVPALALAGSLISARVAIAISCSLTLLVLLRAVRSVGIFPISFDKTAYKHLFRTGAPFVVCGVAMVLQPNVDAYYVSKVSPEEVMGWFAIAKKLIGVLLFPAAALIGALYPTLCRLQSTDKEGFASATRGSLQAVSLAAIPVALGCGLFPDIGVSIVSQESYAPAENNLRISAVFLFLVYFTMPLGISLMAAGRQHAWAAVQAICVVVSLSLNPVLVPWFQQRTGNGGLGVCVAGVISEVLVLIGGIALAPRGIINLKLLRSLALAAIAGGAMALVAYFTRPLNSVLAAGLSSLTYAVVLWRIGGIDKQQTAALRAFLSRKLARFGVGRKG
jgi:O-antigen/teichoic acid export membrane protein